MARREEWNQGISLYARQKTGDSFAIAQPFELREANKNLYAEPFAKIEIQEAQQLMDELWQCGLRPTEGAGSAGSLMATEKHLKDMQKIVYKKLGIE